MQVNDCIINNFNNSISDAFIIKIIGIYLEIFALCFCIIYNLLILIHSKMHRTVSAVALFFCLSLFHSINGQSFSFGTAFGIGNKEESSVPLSAVSFNSQKVESTPAVVNPRVRSNSRARGSSVRIANPKTEDSSSRGSVRIAPESQPALPTVIETAPGQSSSRFSFSRVSEISRIPSTKVIQKQSTKVSYLVTAQLFN